MWRSVAVLVVLADAVAGFQGSWLPTAPALRTELLSLRPRPAVSRPLLCGARSQMGFNTGDEASKSSSDNNKESSTGSPGGMPGGMPGMPPGMEELFSDPEIASAMNDPKFIQAMEEMRTGGPAAMAKYATDAEFMALMNKVQSKMASVAGGMPGMPPGMPGFGAGGMPNMPPGMDKVLGDPEIMKALQQPKMMKVMMEMMQGGPEAMKKYESDPEIADLIVKIQTKLGTSGSAPTTSDGPSKTDDKSSAGSARLDWEASKFRTTNPNAGSFGFEAVLNENSGTKSPQSKKDESPPAGGLDEQQREAFERLFKRQSESSSPSAGTGKIGFDIDDGKSSDGASSLEEGLKARIADVEQRTQNMIDQQQKEAFERLKARQAEEAAARKRFEESERKYKEVEQAAKNIAARDREKFVQDAVKLDPDMAKYKERVELMETTSRQWNEIKEQLRILQVGSGIQFLDPATGEPGPAAYALIALTLALPLIFGVQVLSSVFGALQALRPGGAPDEFDSYDPGAYLPPIV